MSYGITIILISTTIFSVISFLANILELNNTIAIFATITMQALTILGICIVTSNALALSLADYKKSIGTASSLFGFFYYCLISLFTFIMGSIHNNNLLTMPFYFLFFGMITLTSKKIFLSKLEV